MNPHARVALERVTRQPYAAETVAYMAHPVSGDIKKNLENAKKWFRWIQDNLGYTVCANWITMVEMYNDEDQKHRKAALFRDWTVLSKCDAIVLVGGEVTEGMKSELDAAVALKKQIVDLTCLGYEVPE